MNRSRFLRGLGFALLAGGGSVLWLLVAAGPYGYARAAALWFLFCVVLHPLAASARGREGGGAMALALALGAPIALAGANSSVTLALALVVLALTRSARLYRRPFARALLFELVFLGAGLLLAVFFYDGGLAGVAFASWAFWLVQAGFALTATSSSDRDPPADAFERAHAAAVAVLERRSR